MATGRNDGLCQDYCKGLALWFSSRLDARDVVRRVCREIEARRKASDHAKPIDPPPLQR